ncbi:MAG: methylenetetrahydrofolate reductase [Capsulimonadaceae bacterium]
MSFTEKLAAGVPTLSYEFLPPKAPADWAVLYSTLGELPRLAPDFVSVTYGAGGSTRQRTVDLVSRIQRELEVETVPHLTCVGHSRGELAEILDMLNSAGIGTIMALRGDPPGGNARFQPHPDGFTYASELISFIRQGYNFQPGCAFYPEKHPEAVSLEEDIRALRIKQDNGARFATSQLFFDNDVFYRYRDLATAAGVTIPLVVGILSVTSAAQLAETGFVRRCGATVPAKLLDAVAVEPKGVLARGVEYAVRQCDDLLRNGVAGIHLYTMNRATSSSRVTEALRGLGHFPTRKSSTKA